MVGVRSLWDLVYEKKHGKSMAFCLVFFIVRMSLKKRRRALSRGRNPRKWWISSEFRMSVPMFSTFGGREVSGHCKVLSSGQQPGRYCREYTILHKKMQGSSSYRQGC